MKLQKFTTEDTEKKSFRFLKSSVTSEFVSSPKEYPLKKEVNVERLKDGIKRRIL